MFCNDFSGVCIDCSVLLCQQFSISLFFYFLAYTVLVFPYLSLGNHAPKHFENKIWNRFLNKNEHDQRMFAQKIFNDLVSKQSRATQCALVRFRPRSFPFWNWRFISVCFLYHGSLLTPRNIFLCIAFLLYFYSYAFLYCINCSRNGNNWLIFNEYFPKLHSA